MSKLINKSEDISRNKFHLSSQMVVKELTAELEKMRTAYQELQAELAATKIKMEEMKKDHKKLIDEVRITTSIISLVNFIVH